MTPEDRDAMLLAMLRSVTAQLDACERFADALRGWRDRLVIQLAEDGRPHGDIAAAAAMTVQGIGKITRAAGLARYRRGGASAPRRRRESWPPPRRASASPSSSGVPSTTPPPEPS